MLEVIGEVLLGLGSAAIGLVVGSAVFAVVRAARWALLRSERSTAVVDPDGGRWAVRVPLAPTPMRFAASTWLLRMRPTDRREREASGVAPDGVSRTELAHPRQLVREGEEAAAFIAVAMALFVVAAVAVLLIEAILVALIGAVIAAARVTWGRWQCEVTAPDGQRFSVTVGSLRDARARAALIGDAITRHGSATELLT